MFNYNKIEGLHLEISEKCNSKCGLCSRYLKNGETNPNLKDRELYLEDIKSIFDLKFIQQLNFLIFCGNYGDPICNKDLIPIIEYFKKCNKNISTKIHTNGSMRNKEFWEELPKYGDKVIFAIDGLEDTHSIYRQNISYNKVIENAKIFIKSGGHAVWDYIVFEHNEHQVEKAMVISKEIGFKEFILKRNNRVDRLLGVPDYLRNPKNEKYRMKNFIDINEIDTFIDQAEIDCSCKTQIFITAEGLITPCCWIGYLKNYGDATKEHTEIIRKVFSTANNNAKYNSIQSIVEGPFFKMIQDSWDKKNVNSGKLRTCSYCCPKNNNQMLQ